MLSARIIKRAASGANARQASQTRGKRRKRTRQATQNARKATQTRKATQSAMSDEDDLFCDCDWGSWETSPPTSPAPKAPLPRAVHYPGCGKVVELLSGLPADAGTPKPRPGPVPPPVFARGKSADLMREIYASAAKEEAQEDEEGGEEELFNAFENTITHPLPLSSQLCRRSSAASFASAASSASSAASTIGSLAKNVRTAATFKMEAGPCRPQDIAQAIGILNAMIEIPLDTEDGRAEATQLAKRFCKKLRPHTVEMCSECAEPFKKCKCDVEP